MPDSAALLQQYEIFFPSPLDTNNSSDSTSSKSIEILIKESCPELGLSPLFTEEWTGTRVWDAAFALIKYVCCNVHELLGFILVDQYNITPSKEKTLKSKNASERSKIKILELGSGTGFGGIAIAKMLAFIKAYENQLESGHEETALFASFAECNFDVVLTDQLSVLPILISNLRLNFENIHDFDGITPTITITDNKSSPCERETNSSLEVDLSFGEKNSISIKALELLWGYEKNTPFSHKDVSSKKSEVEVESSRNNENSDNPLSNLVFNLVFFADCINPIYGENTWYDLYISLVKKTKCGSLIYFSQERRGDNHDVNLFLNIMKLHKNEMLSTNQKSLADFDIVNSKELNLNKTEASDSAFGDIHEVSTSQNGELNHDRVIDLIIFRRV